MSMVESSLQIKFFSVGCGDAISIRFKGNDEKFHNILIDGGEERNENNYKNGIKKEIDAIVARKDKEIIERLKNLNNYSSELSEIKNNKYLYVIPKHYLEHLNGIEYKNLPPESDRPEFEL